MGREHDHSRYQHWIDPNKVKPYERNAKIHTEKQIRNIANSISKLGWQQDTVITRDNILVIGHGRRLAAIELGCLMPYHYVDKKADELTDEDIRELRIADNQVNAETGMDMSMLYDELQDLDFDGFDFDLSADDIKLAIEEKEFQHEQNKEQTRYDVLNILNLEKGQFVGEGLYDIPIIEPVYELPQIKEWIGFNYVLSDKNPEGKAVHFFIDDYQFERIWNNPEKHVDKLRQYVCVASPDFSPYGDMPHATQIFNHYRKHWCAVWLQQHGVTVIPTIRCSTDERSLDWYLDGEPHESIVIYSSMWAKDNPDVNKTEFQRMKRRLKPKKIFVYGGYSEYLGITKTDNVDYIDSFTQKRWTNTEQ